MLRRILFWGLIGIVGGALGRTMSFQFHHLPPDFVSIAKAAIGLGIASALAGAFSRPQKPQPQDGETKANQSQDP